MVRKMRRIVVISVLALFGLFSCTQKTEKNDTLREKENTEEVIAHGSIDTLSISDTLINKGRVTMQQILESFRYCKETAENDLQCKYFISKAIDDYFGVKDFMVNGDYLNFEDILFAVKSNSKWKSLGMAKSQASLDEAQRIANNGKPVLAIHTGSKFGHVVIVMPGKLEKAMSWGNLNCPQVASFFMVQDYESFVDKSIAFAWSSPEGIELFARE